ncbi:substrate-binding periplasmic protein [Alteromonas stellipolaris]|uniref:substrate-binding periplasmic protein n=1 Tax=Alteromonas stellipolaris TaxID=233316 RepID=UPI0027366515|nr:transporter substrate-binding domain-containing protein [Alteromonas stellipolaris]MDP2537931.1 transporter substrate-binding domain-containing protein [Alteromonas stellipolaris]
MRLLAIFTLLLALVPLQSWGHAWLKIKIATTEYAPYTSSEMEHKGYINHIISQAFLETGVVVEFVSMPWDEAVEATLNGEFDALSYGNFVRARGEKFWHSDPITAESLVFYVNAKSDIASWSSFDELKDKKMGVTEGYLYNNELATYIENTPSVTTYATDKENLEALVSGEIDLFPIDDLTGWYLLQRDFTGEQRQAVSTIDPFISTVTTHLLVAKGRNDDRLLIELFNKGLEELTLDGKLTRFKRLLKDGFYQDPKRPVNFDRR